MSRTPGARGVDYRINFVVGRSADSVRRLTEALRELNTAVVANQTAFGTANPAQNLYANGIAALATALTQLRTILPQMNAALNQQAAAANRAAAANANLTRSAMNMSLLGSNGSRAWQAGLANIAAQRQQAAALVAAQQAAAQATAQMTAQVQAQVNAIGSSTGGMNMMTVALSSFLALTGANRVASFIQEITLLAGRVENLATAMLNIGRVNNVTAGQMYITQDAMKKLGITTQVAREIITRFAQNNLDMADSLKIARIAQDAAVVAGLNSSDTAERMMIAVQRLDTRMLRNIGILVNLRNEYQKVAIATGRYENSLSAAEKQEIVMQAVIRAGVALQGTYEKSLEDVFKQWTSLDRKIEEAQRTIGENFLPIFKVVVVVFDTFLEALTSANGTVAAFAAILLGMVAGVTALGVALSFAAAAAWALDAAFAANPLLAIAIPSWILAAAVIGGLIAALSSLFSLQGRMDKQAEVRSHKQAYEKVRVKEIADEMTRLSAIANRSHEQELQLLTLKNEAMSLYGEKMDAATKKALIHAKSTQEFIDVLNQSQKLGLPAGMDNDMALSRLNDRYKKKKAELDAMNEARKDSYIWMGEDGGGDPGGVGLTIERWLLGVGKLEEEAKKAKRDFENLETTINQMKLKRFEDMTRQLTSMTVTVHNAKKAIKEANLEGMSDNGKSLMKYVDILQTLAVAHTSIAMIQEEENIKIREATKLSDQEIERQSKKLKGEELEDAKLKEKEALRAKILQIQVDSESKQADYNDLVASEKILHEEILRLLEEQTTAHKNAAYMHMMVSKGLGDIGAQMLAVETAAAGMGRAIKSRTQDIMEAKKKLADLNKSIAEGDQFTDTGGVDKAKERASKLADSIKLQEQALQGELPQFGDKVQEIMDKTIESSGAGKKALDEVAWATAKMRMEAALAASGIDSGLASALIQGAEDMHKYEETQQKLIDNYSVLAQKVAMLTAMQAQFGAMSDPAWKMQIDKMREAMGQIGDAIKAQDEFRKEQEKATLAKIAEMRAKSLKEQLEKEKESTEKSLKELGKMREDAAKKISDIDKKQADDKEKTEDAIFKRDIEFRKKHPTQQGAIRSAMYEHEQKLWEGKRAALDARLLKIATTALDPMDRAAAARARVRMLSEPVASTEKERAIQRRLRANARAGFHQRGGPGSNPVDDAMVADALGQGFDFFKGMRGDVEGASGPKDFADLERQWNRQMADTRKNFGDKNGNLPPEIEQAITQWAQKLNDAKVAREAELKERVDEKLRQQAIVDATQKSAELLALIASQMGVTPGMARGGMLRGAQNAMTPSDMAIQMASNTMPGLGSPMGAIMGGTMYQTMLNNLLTPAQKAAAATQGMADAQKSASSVITQGLEAIEKFSDAATVQINNQKDAWNRSTKSVDAKVKSLGLK